MTEGQAAGCATSESEPTNACARASHATSRSFGLVLVPSGNARLPPGMTPLAVVRFGSEAADDCDGFQLVGSTVGLHPADGRIATELWWSRLAVERDRVENVAYVANGDVLFAEIHFDQAEHLEDLVCRGYEQMIQVARIRGYPHILRVWNVVEGLNNGTGDSERYKRFSIGRARALRRTFNRDCDLPSATCVGTATPGIVIHMIASRSPGYGIENPRQVSAWKYPRDYGPHSPAFSRAMLYASADGSLLFVSGTASIVGHRSVHATNMPGQVDETLRNLDALLDHASRVIRQRSGRSLASPLGLRIYLRDCDYYAFVRSRVDRWSGSETPKVFLHADICRRELLVEIEGVWAVE